MWFRGISLLSRGVTSESLTATFGLAHARNDPGFTVESLPAVAGYRVA
jgi:hypothetical protein